MLRYIATAFVGVMLLGIALRSQSLETSEPETSRRAPSIDAKVVAVPGGMDVLVQHRFAGRLSRASLVYELKGERCVVTEANNCQRSLASSPGRLIEENSTTLVEISGHVPDGAEDVRLVVEDETGVRALSVPLH